MAAYVTVVRLRNAQRWVGHTQDVQSTLSGGGGAIAVVCDEGRLYANEVRIQPTSSAEEAEIAETI